MILIDLLNWYIDDLVFKFLYIDMVSNNYFFKLSVFDLYFFFVWSRVDLKYLVSKDVNNAFWVNFLIGLG